MKHSETTKCTHIICSSVIGGAIMTLHPSEQKVNQLAQCFLFFFFFFFFFFHVHDAPLQVKVPRTVIFLPVKLFLSRPYSGFQPELAGGEQHIFYGKTDNQVTFIVQISMLASHAW